MIVFTAIVAWILAVYVWCKFMARWVYTNQIQREVHSVISRMDQCLDNGNYDRSEIVRWSDHLKAITGLSPSTMALVDYRKLMRNSKLRQYELFRDSVSGGTDDESQSGDQPIL